jgi:hypothetical protein
MPDTFHIRLTISLSDAGMRDSRPAIARTIVRRTEYNHWVAPPFQSTPDISTVSQPGAAAGSRVHLHNWGIDTAVWPQHMRRKTYTQTSRFGLPPSPALDHDRSIRNWVLVEAW